ncbi:MAG: hypothetical protein HQK96_07905 [Nitrospirae bacterium]|nr:hypothetical protein [Nitrospirota bacterium]
MIAADKDEIRKIVVEVLHDLMDESQPPDRMVLFLYQLVGDFKEFKIQANAKFDSIEQELKSVKDELLEEVGKCLTKDDFDKEIKKYLTKDHFDKEMKKYLTKDDFDKRMLDYIIKIGVGVRDAIREELGKTAK